VSPFGVMAPGIFGVMAPLRSGGLGVRTDFKHGWFLLLWQPDERPIGVTVLDCDNYRRRGRRGRRRGGAGPGWRHRAAYWRGTRRPIHRNLRWTPCPDNF